MFFDWDMEHERAIDSQDRLRLVYAQPQVEQEWSAQKRLAALILWRAAYDRDLLIDDVELSSIRSYYNPTLGPRLLHDGPSPAVATKPMDGGGPFSELLHQVAVILDPHAVLDTRKTQRVGPSTTVGYRVRELRSTPGWFEGDWKTDLTIARDYRESAWQKREDGSWQITPEDLQAAAQASPAEPAYDYPTVPIGPDGYRLWLQGAHHLVMVGTTLSAVANTLPRTADGYLGPLAMVLSGHAGACHSLSESANDIDRLWAAEPVQPRDLSYWDLSYVPDSLREQTEEIKTLIHELRVWLAVLAP
uniref:Uncharacterized protein n=1 Tax=Streptomyces sp. NBC_00003 TaxID=2903608 RepID=A0AAU2V851_9ACTN